MNRAIIFLEFVWKYVIGFEGTTDSQKLGYFSLMKYFLWCEPNYKPMNKSVNTDL